MKTLRAIAGLLGLCLLGALGFVLLLLTMSERLVKCDCSDGTQTSRMVSGWERDEHRVCAKACSGHGGGEPAQR